jgi:hypothetical protein
MEVKFIDTPPEEVKACFPEFYASKKVFFEIVKEPDSLGFYGIKDIGNDVGEISVYFSESGRRKITKNVAFECLKFPSRLGFKKVLISTKVRSIERFLKKMSKIGISYLFQNEDLHWFEVNYELW